MRKRLVVTACALAALAAVAISASPAVAGSGTSQSHAVCEDASFDFLRALERSGTARGTEFTTRLEKETEKYSGGTEIGQTTPGKPTAGTIDVYFHIITETDGTGAVRDATVAEQIAVLNLTFGGFYSSVPGDDTGFRFRLVETTRTANDAWFAQETFADEVAMKSNLKRGDAADLNIYSTSGGGYLGWAYYPSITASNTYSVLDGVVIHYGSLPGGAIRNYNKGYTATHEVGHYLGLPHTFEQGCTGHGDYVDDTPAMLVPTSGCPADGTKDTCPRDAGFDPIHNYMDYSYDICYTHFTPGQAERMQKQFAHWRLKRV